MRKRQHLINGRLIDTPDKASRTFGFAEHRILSVDKENRSVRAVVSTAALDSYGESVLPEAFTKRLPERFNKNAPLIAGHIYHASDGSLGKIGEWESMSVEEVPGVGRALVGTAKFFSGTRLTDECWTIVEQSSSIAFSVGWITHAVEMRDIEIDGLTRKVRVYTDVELIEVSLVTVPANPEAVVQSSLVAQRDVTVAWGDPGELAELLNKWGDKIEEIDRAVAAVEQIKTVLDPEPGSLLHELVLSTCRQMQGVQHHGTEPDPVDDPPRSFADQVQEALAEGA